MSKWNHAPSPCYRDHPVLGEMWWKDEGREQPFLFSPHVGHWVSYLNGKVILPQPYPTPTGRELNEKINEQRKWQAERWGYEYEPVPYVTDGEALAHLQALKADPWMAANDAAHWSPDAEAVS